MFNKQNFPRNFDIACKSIKLGFKIIEYLKIFKHYNIVYKLSPKPILFNLKFQV